MTTAGKALHGLLAMIVVATALPAAGRPVAVVDDEGRLVRLPAAATRIVSLSPHITEALFEAGAGDLVVGTVRYSDYPEDAKKIPRVGDQAMLDMERIVSLKPDLIVAWLHGTSARQLAKVRTLGIPVFESEQKSLADISESLVKIGLLVDREGAARRAAARYDARLQALRAKYSARPSVSLFYQVWKEPLLTINGGQIISDVIRLCGGKNVFENSALLVPSVDREAVAQADPEAIVAASSDPEDRHPLEEWRTLPSLRATARDNLIVIRTETLGRPSPRILEGATRLCEALEAARSKRR